MMLTIDFSNYELATLLAERAGEWVMAKTHFYTSDPNERQNAINNLGFHDEGIACYVYGAPPPGPAPLYRAYHPTTEAHFYTMSLPERDNATNTSGYVGEGIACYIYGQQQPGAVPLYRAFQPASDDHFYTTSLAEHNNAVQHLGYNDEGVTGHVMPGPASGVIPLYRMYGPIEARHLEINMEHQRQSSWCWAATTVSITRYYDPATTWTQCTLANHVFSQTTCCTDGSSPQCNRGSDPGADLDTVSRLASKSNRPATFATIMREITASRPIAMTIQWNGSGFQHVPIIDGYDNFNSAAPTIDIKDPWFGASTQDFNSFPNAYQGGATWLETYFTK